MPEEFRDKVNRILRDHEGYTGDGKGGSGALPIGDRSTARKPIDKRDLRESLLAYGDVIDDAQGHAADASASAAIAATAVGVVFGPKPDTPLQLIAHRGGVQVGVQNTMPTLTTCLDWADAVEADVVVTSDGVTRLYHDNTLDTLTDKTGNVTEVTSAYMDTARFKKLAGNPMEDFVKIPRLEDFLEWAVARGVTIYVEMKGLRDENDVDLIVDQVLAAGAEKQTILQSSNLDHTVRALARNGNISCGYLVSGGGLSARKERVDTLSAFPGRGWLLSAHAPLANEPEIISYAHARGVGIGAWTVNTKPHFDAMMKIGVRHIMTDLPIADGGRYA